MVNVQALLGALATYPPRSACFIDEALKLLILGLVLSSAGLLGFLNYWTLD
jgi:hypothetical protein